MGRILARQALTAAGWRSNVALEWDEAGQLVGVTPGAPADGPVYDLVLPAPVNCHSHAFQRAMAGLTEQRGPGARDTFWTWRQLMFRFLERITPEQVEAVAAFVQMEMLQAGFGASVEFHYLHHAPGGAAYDDLGEMSARIAAAAETSGIGLTLLPVLYRFGGCDGRPLGPGQDRFGCTPDQFARLIDAAGRSIAALPGDCRLGVAPHSLRAVGAEDLASLPALVPDGPIHMHLAEQIAEVEEVQAHLGARPVDWALANLDLSPRWCLIHCTQMTPRETRGLAATGAIAGLCPLTEASLGDGVFDGIRWAEAGGALAVGSDSNIRISLAEELRQLDTSQRLRDHSRAAFATAEVSTGVRLLTEVAQGGATAAARGSGQIATGAPADLLALDTKHPDLAGLSGATAVDSFVFAGGNEMVSDVWSGGRHLVRAGQHVRQQEITARYTAAVASLRDGL